ncbi:TetR/AcrR family transcriptional regulator [Chlorobium phaeobacteroides]|uniref:Transcriptional regulator, TetR family n=1 Tax=Chlorobium phaeobacteroides (strain DSM 266 / SMG 266 / 2430) TaxID=290317 RepID=A1BFU6_CHLPD|nr:TetR/AcrR family transcriptional regulator [Chlorobium phaeobacteroides]ABL65273.1 transcriptional regulator, TetR family [Chlorobium phaeobacteroides DSM 266]
MKRVVKNLSAERRRAVTVETVIELAGEKNPAEITTADIALRMKLTQGALFRHFPTKDALWESVMTWVAGQIFSRVDTAVAQTDSPLAALENMFKSHINFVAHHPGVPGMIFSELQRPVKSEAKKFVETMLSRYGERIKTLLQKGIELGEVDPDLDVAAASVMFIGNIQGLVMQSLIAGDTTVMLQNARPVFSLYKAGIIKR